MLGTFNWAPTAGQLALGASAPAVLGSSAWPAPGWAGVAGGNSVACQEAAELCSGAAVIEACDRSVGAGMQRAVCGTALLLGVAVLQCERGQRASCAA